MYGPSETFPSLRMSASSTCSNSTTVHRLAVFSRARRTVLMYVQLVTALGISVFLGCGPREVTCEFQGQTYETGDRISDAQRALICTCTSEGLRCADASGAALDHRRTSRGQGDELAASNSRGGWQNNGALDAAVDRPGVMMDGGVDVHSADVDSDLDMDVAIDGPAPSGLDGALDAPDASLAGASNACPTTIRHGSACPMNEAMCGTGLGFNCCGVRFQYDTVCRCQARRWVCEDDGDTCRQLDNGNDCTRRGQVCARWHEMERVRMVGEGEWNGNVEMCELGHMSDEWRERVLTLVNGYRFLAGLGEVTLDPALNEKAQACAVAQHALGLLEHNLPTSAQCYSEAAREASKASNLHRRPAVAAMRDYIADPGRRNYTKMWHRQWILANQLGPVGVGSTNRYSCLYVWYGVEGDVNTPRWIAWPPPGPFPVGAGVADRMGWTIHSTSVNLSRAQVTVSVDGDTLPVEFRVLEGMGPAGWAIAFVPDGWNSRAGIAYDVRVDGVFGHDWEGPIEYRVEMTDCAQ